MRARRPVRLTGGGPVWDARPPRDWEAPQERRTAVARADLLMALDDTLRDIAAAVRRGDTRLARSLYGRAARYCRMLPPPLTRRHRPLLDGLADRLWPSRDRAR
ncbi:hypothetical protein [Streptomyces sp. HB2AG]|uniref:hypothetical protein n=1 Tax=Streptomyces sp. HB2AG TaxID=2983400 RepID=UPI0022AB4127|nr:hypothetical protein [Streptomyces sp. HB2AG]MCZ2525373.1 hypothetical protein [Streptomyces sp. HB2AG]